MKLKLIVFLTITALVTSVSPSFAMWYTMDFTNATYDIGAETQIDLTSQYSAFGLSFHKVYRYIDGGDPWDGFGISNGFKAQNYWQAALGTIFLGTPSDSVGFDFWTIDDEVFNLDAFAADGSFLGGVASGGSGTGMIVAEGISYLEFHNDGGFVQISNLSYERGRVIPEPATMTLLGLGLLGAGVVSRMRRKRR
jgi:hypothetical protein